MKTPSLDSQLCDSPICRCVAFTLITLWALGWNGHAFGDDLREKALNWNSQFPASREIHDAADHGDLAKVRALVKAQPNLVFSRVLDRNDGETPLHCAAMNGHKEVVELLLANKADVNAMDNNGATPLLYSVSMDRKDVVELLLAHGADVNAGTPLYRAAEVGNRDVVELLLAHGADVNAGTPLYAAAEGGNRDVVELLLANKADVNAMDDAGRTPLYCAAMHGHMEVVELLLANKADVNPKEPKGHHSFTPLSGAIHGRYDDVVELLVGKGAVDAEYRSARGYRLNYPSGWKILTEGEKRDLSESPIRFLKGIDFSRITAMIYDPDFTTRNVNVVVSSAPVPVDKEHVPQIESELRDQFAAASMDVEDFESKVVHVSDHDAILSSWIASLRPVLAKRVWQEQFLIPGKRHSYIITCSDDVASRSAVQAVFANIVASFQIVAESDETPGELWAGFPPAVRNGIIGAGIGLAFGLVVTLLPLAKQKKNA